jgi:hypothetical protein
MAFTVPYGAGKHFFLQKEAKTFIHWRARCGNAGAL